MSVTLGSESLRPEPRDPPPPRRGLLFVDARPFMRDCMMRWLAGELPDQTLTVLADASLFARETADALPAIGVLCVAGGRARPEASLRDQVEALRSRDEAMPIVVLVDDQDCDRTEAIVEALSLQGYIPTSSSSSVVHAALRLVLAGGTYHPHSVRRSPVRLEEALRLDRGDMPLGRASQAALTPREDRVLDLLAKGLPNKIIAYRLGVSVSTVKVHVHHLIQKLQAQNRTELAVLAPGFRDTRPPMGRQM